MSYEKKDKYDFFLHFYENVNNIIYDIHANEEIQKNLFYCNYITINDRDECEYPFTICLGGGGYVQYQHIFELNNIKSDNQIKSYDYDISMAIKGYINKNEFVENIKKIINDNLKNVKYKNITFNNFSIEKNLNSNRIHIRVIFDSKIHNEDKFHILELSFWLNGKISDNFTINDFTNNSIYLYIHQNIFYYLLPIELLVKTTLYAIVDFFEKRNFNKCIKYIDRVKSIKKAYDEYEKLQNPSNELSFILEKYKNKIKRKYKIINDYPFLISYYLNFVNDKKKVKFIYRNLRVDNRKNIKKLIKKYDDRYKNNNSNYQTDNSQNTQIDTDDEANNQ